MTGLILKWLGANWITLLLGTLVLGAFIYVKNLEGSRDAALQRAQELEVLNQELATEAKRQADAFQRLKDSFDDYKRSIEAYLKSLEAIEADNEGAKDIVNNAGTEDARTRPVDPYIREVLEKLCTLYPKHCQGIP